MKSKLLLVAAIAAGLSALVACDRDRDNTDVPATTAMGATEAADTGAVPADGNRMGTPETDAGMAGDAAMGTGPDGRALAMLNAINAHEIAASQQALEKGVEGDVAAYARMMIEQHTENRQKTTSLASTATSGANAMEGAVAGTDPGMGRATASAADAMGTAAGASDAQALRAKSERELATLGQQNGAAYSSAYIDAMVKGHTEALALLDDQLIPSATRPEVKAHLTTSREHVAEHLERAKALQAQARS
jgi:putative membrane protein